MRRLRRWRGVIDEVMRAPDGVEALQMVWRYILLADVRHPPEEVMARLGEAVGKRRKKQVLSAGEILIERGQKEGERKILLRMLRLRFGELSVDVTARIDAAESEQIERWADRVLTAATLDEVLGAA
jgi:hypothetical protein